MTVADVLVRRLRDAGVRQLFGVPGGGSNLDVIAAAQRIGLRFVLTATETAAALAALAQTEISGGVGVCLTGLGPGAASVVNGAACALLDRAAILVISDAHPAAADGCEHQRLDQRALLAPVTKWGTALTSVNVHAVVAEAIQRATTAPRGPVHLDCPADVATTPTVDRPRPTEEAADRPTADRRLPTADRLPTAGRLLTVRKPLLIAGLGAREHASAVRAFVRSHHVPAMVTYKAKGVVPDRDAWFAGVFTNGALEQEIVADADLLITIGLDRVELLPRPWTPRQAVVAIDADIDGRLTQLSAELPPAEWDVDELQRVIAMQRDRLTRHQADASRSAAGSLTPDAVVGIASAAMPNARVTVDAGAHMFPATLLWPVDEPNGMLISNGLSTMGFAVPAAIGAASTDRDRPVVALVGDGGLLMSVGELATLARERLRVVVIVFNDRSLSLIDIKQRQRGYERSGVALGGVAWADVARACGLEAHVVATAGDLAGVLAAARACQEPVLVDARVDPACYEQMIRIVRG